MFRIVILFLFLLHSSSSLSLPSERVSVLLRQIIRDSFQFCDLSIATFPHTLNAVEFSDPASLLNFHTVVVVSPISTTDSKSVLSLIKRHQPCMYKLHILFLKGEKDSSWMEMEVSKKGLLRFSQLSKDYFIFVTSYLPSASKILLSKEIGLKMKNKVALVHHPSHLQIYTSCIYCNQGKPKLIQFPDVVVRTARNLATLFPDYMTEFNGALLRMCAPKIPPRFTLVGQPDGSFKLTRGLYKYLVEDALQIRYNFTYEITKSHNWAVGNQDSKKAWNGIMKDVLENRVDVGLSVGFTLQRYPFIEYGSMIEAEYLTFSSGKRPPYLSWKAIFWAFRKDMWMATSLTFFTAYWVVYLLVKWGRTKEQVINNPEAIFRYLYATFLDQSIADPRAWYLRIFCGTWLLYSLVVSNAFREKLFGFLGFPLDPVLPQSFEDLAESKFEIGLQFYGGAAYNYIKSSKSGPLTKIGARMSLETDPIRCFTKALDKQFTCIHYHGAAEFVKARNLSDRHGMSNIVVAPASTLFLPISFIMQKDNLLMEKFNNVVNWVRDMGLVSEWKRMDFNKLLKKRVRWEMENGIFKETTDLMSFDHVRALRLNQLLGVFGLLCLGSMGGAIAFLGEQGSKFDWIFIVLQEYAIYLRYYVVAYYNHYCFN